MTQPVGVRIAEAAVAQLGTPFRLHGRRAQTGLDCVGLVLLALRQAQWPVAEPPPYTVKGATIALVQKLVESAGLVACEDILPGDIVLARSGPGQFHLMIQSDGAFVHAHAGLGRVVLMPAPSPWPLAGRWRVASQR